MEYAERHTFNILSPILGWSDSYIINTGSSFTLLTVLLTVCVLLEFTRVHAFCVVYVT